jgi:hypothetical protein
MAKYVKRVHGSLSIEDKEKFLAIQKENKEITVRYILEEFINNYCETKPKGIKIKIKEIESKIKENEDKINTIKKENVELYIELKTYKDRLNKTLDNYIDEDLIKAVNSVIKTCKQKNIEMFNDVPEQIFISIAKHSKISLETLKKEVEKEFI